MTAPRHDYESPKTCGLDPQAKVDPAKEEASLTWAQTILSGLSAAIGIQSAATRDRDFAKGSLLQFLVVGVVLTGLFIGALLLVVTSLLP
tara:strand:+ start:359 stop:628 length:270 start_codon:yes stop_codon:yes gene_type:complete